MKYQNNRKRFPCEEVCPADFLTNEEIEKMQGQLESLKFNKEDWRKLLNCVHCNECGTDNERALLLNEYIKRGNEYPTLDAIRKNFREFDTPYATNQMRIRIPSNIQKESKTYFLWGAYQQFGFQDIRSMLLNI
ncbi:MAG: hypothetical protein ACTSRZ_00770 [Promethearchaeota archaeon]